MQGVRIIDARNGVGHAATFVNNALGTHDVRFPRLWAPLLDRHQRNARPFNAFAQMRDLRGARQVHEGQVEVCQWQTNFGEVGGEHDPEACSGIHELAQIGLLRPNDTFVGQTNICAFEITARTHQLGFRARQRGSRRRKLGLGPISLLPKFSRAVKFYLSLLDERFRLIDGDLVVGRVDPEQDVTFIKYAAGDEFRRNTRDRAGYLST